MLRLSCAVASLLLLAAPARADQAPHTHEGFFLRLDLGLGYSRSTTSQGTSNVAVSGGTTSIGINLGGALYPNLILSGHLFANIVSQPTVSVDGTNVPNGGLELTLNGLGPSLTWYIMPANVYLTGTVGVGWLDFKNSTQKSDAGIAGRLALGKEWWVSDHWGLGVEGQLSAGSVPTSGSGSARYTTWSPTIAFTATFN